MLFSQVPIPTRKASGHAITVVGWDNNIPKEKFRVTIDGQDYEPMYDGAFIAKNSYGETTGENGYFYISYCSAYFSNNLASAVIAEPTRSDVNVLYMHDPYGYTGFLHKNEPVSGKEIWAKNVFSASSDQLLKSVSFYAMGMDQEYDVYVDTGDGLTLAASGINQYAGYYTVDLQAEIMLKKGTEFSVTVCQKNLSGTEITAALEQTVNGYTSQATAKPGQSFLSFDGATWRDISDELDANNCIKAYAYDKSAPDNTIVTEETINSGNVLESMAASLPMEAALPAESFVAGTRAQVSDNLPAAFNLRNIGAVTSVKNQGSPPTCWTFATMGSTESGLLKSASGFDTGVNISANTIQRQINLDENEGGYATATVTQNGGSGSVYWHFSGDINDLDIQNKTSVSGEQTLLFIPKQEGRVVATAISTDDGTKSAQVVFDIVRSGAVPSRNPEPDPPAAESKTVQNVPPTDDRQDIRVYLTMLLCAAGVLLVFVSSKKRIGNRKK
ncbi:lectin like domain-containing protein [Christensenellaceae bacterium OttesenSCG-928-K19]|nr:lectin like domain-containing protein [Christensenellaceae bacterium OttesenSCG-928-K19]